MVLLINGVKVNKVPEDSEELYRLAPQLKQHGSQFAAAPLKQLGGEGLLFVSQSEFASITQQDENFSVVATDGCTTCLTLILRHPTSGCIAFAHMEETCVHGITDMLKRLKELTPSSVNFVQEPVQMFLYGSYSDDQGFGEEIIEMVLDYVHHKVQQKVDLMEACVGIVNTDERGENCVPWPLVYGVGINVKTGDIFSVQVLEKGPDLALRQARLFTGSHQLLDIYDNRTGLLRIGPFGYIPIECSQFILEQTDEFIRQRLSTSPEVEQPDFVEEVKLVLKHFLEHPFPELTVFRGNKSRFHKKNKNGSWSLVGEWQMKKKSK